MNLLKKISLSILVCFIFLVSFIIAPNNLNASGLWENQEGFKSGSNEIGNKFDNDGSVSPPQMIIINVIKTFLGLLGIIFLSIIIYSGFKYMTAGGNEDQVKDALIGIRNGVIGLLIILMSFAITNFITTCAIDATSKDASSAWYCSIK